jgi:hypothetical protein
VNRPARARVARSTDSHRAKADCEHQPSAPLTQCGVPCVSGRRSRSSGTSHSKARRHTIRDSRPSRISVETAQRPRRCRRETSHVIPRGERCLTLRKGPSRESGVTFFEARIPTRSISSMRPTQGRNSGSGEWACRMRVTPWSQGTKVSLLDGSFGRPWPRAAQRNRAESKVVPGGIERRPDGSRGCRETAATF